MSIQGQSTAQGAISGAGTGIGAGATVGATIGMVGGPAGAVVGAGIGAAIGAVVGGLGGGIGGFMSGGKKRRAKMYMRYAQEEQKIRQEEALKQNLLSQIRQARIERASSLAATVAAGSDQDTGAQGALSSYGAQVGNVVTYTMNDRYHAEKAARYTSRAKKNLSTANAIDTTTQSLIKLAGETAKAGASAYAYSNAPTEADVNTYGHPWSPFRFNSGYNPNTMLPPVKPGN